MTTFTTEDRLIVQIKTLEDEIKRLKKPMNANTIMRIWDDPFYPVENKKGEYIIDRAGIIEFVRQYEMEKGIK